MARIDAERNLLFGVLALQLDFITREALILAVSSWSRDKSRSLDAILVEQGALAESRRILLEPLVCEHLHVHGDDPGASLAAFGVPGTVREGLRPLVDPEVEASLAATPSRADGSSRTLTFDGSFSDSPGSRYKVLRPLARGGIGLVSVALDTELNREVALKQIQPENADDAASRIRFTLEAEVTGRLEHPGVVPVYGLGCGAGGQPYYAMRLIKGESLKEAVARLHAGGDVSRGSLALRGLLNRFVAVCYAVAYAHSRGVIHRDIKPSNIMLGPYGETLVVDWGLAKVVGREEAEAEANPLAEGTLRPGSGSGVNETLAGAAIGTPAYMSPEQAEGKLDVIGPASDVYSLGATLYVLLAGGPPFDDRDVGAVLKRVTKGDFPSPRTLNPRAPRALEAVCLKAMALKPSDRYASARAVAEEVEHWLADEPVKALREPVLTRLARWGRRHKTGVAAGVALLLTAVVGLAAGTLVLQQANARTQRERDLAQYHFRTARKAVDDYLTRVGKNPLLKERGLHDLRRELLGAALLYYQDFLRQQASDPGVRAEAALAYEHVGDIQKELGHFDDALVAYDKGLTLANQSGQAVARLRMEGSRIAVLSPLGRFDEGIAAFQRVTAPFLDGRPVPADVQAVLIKIYNAGVEAYSDSGKGDEALKASQQALEIGEAYTRDHPEDHDALHDLMAAYGYTTRKLTLSGRIDDALRSGHRFLKRGEIMVRDNPGDIDLQVGFAKLATDMATAEMFHGGSDQALTLIRRSSTLLEDLSRKNPLLFLPRHQLITSLSYQSSVECDLKLIPDARRSAERGVEHAELLLKNAPDLLDAQLDLGLSLFGVGKVLFKSGESSKAIAKLSRAADLMERSGEPAYIYNAACCMAISSSIDDATAPGSPTERETRRVRDAERAVALLKNAIDHGMHEPTALINDPDFDPIRLRPDFQALVHELESKAGKLPSPAQK